MNIVTSAGKCIAKMQNIIITTMCTLKTGILRLKKIFKLVSLSYFIRHEHKLHCMILRQNELQGVDMCFQERIFL